jgi:hypothetical protein
MAMSRQSRKKEIEQAARTAVSRRSLVLGMGAVAGGTGIAWAMLGACSSAAGPAIVTWKDPDCDCCAGWIAYMRGKGYRVTVNETADMAAVKERMGVPPGLVSCHTSRIDGYVVEGHVPAPAIEKLLAERPPLKGIAVPGMPEGVPGMPGTPGTYGVVGFDKDGRTRLFAETGV